MTKIDPFHISGSFPLVITPQNAQITYRETLDYLFYYKNELKTLLLQHGGLLFRGFPILNETHFLEVIEAIKLGNLMDNIGGDSPRDKVRKKIYTSSEAPPKFHIPLHQELSFIKHFPKHIYFYSDIVAAEGGSTVIGDARKIYAALDPDVKKRFEERGLTYISHYYYKSKIMNWINRIQRSHKSWTEVFETADKAEVEKRCVQNEFNWRWLPRDWIEIKQHRPAILLHPETNEKVWFNQAHLYDFNPKLLGWFKYIGAKLFYMRKSTCLHEVEFADGSRIPRKDLYHIMDVLEKNTVAFPWQKGDVMVLDNILTMHGRAPFSGKRRVLAAMTS